MRKSLRKVGRRINTLRGPPILNLSYMWWWHLQLELCKPGIVVERTNRTNPREHWVGTVIPVCTYAQSYPVCTRRLKQTGRH